ncbi:NOL1/NOP2/sun family putative RNA methylase [Lachnospiraceae bacterium NE2001]|nr:NOL1/NOP2/sun family putative RNA methylase [Lachnospiraceae bacterium NE2001]
MRRLLGEEYETYVDSLNTPINTCLRVNTLKISVQDFLKISPFELTPVPWSNNGFYYDASTCSPSKHPFYYAGLYYLQEPSATLPAATLPIDEGDKVLDLCAAPGGKSTELAAKLAGTGLLVSNDISASRLKALQKNIEVFGVRNVIITCESPEKLAIAFNGYFDKILIDAPCSGEGMFRKSTSMVTAWEINGNEKFAEIQRSILKEAVKMLRPGGMILYSTCTFDPMEDEDQVMYLMELGKDLSLVPIEYHDGFVPGNPDWSNDPNASSDLKYTYHLFPHRIKGEGHYVALLKSNGEIDRSSYINNYDYKPYSKLKPVPEIDDFLSHIKKLDKASLEYRNDKLYLIPDDSPALPGYRVMRRGVYLGELKKKRFEPSQSFAMILDINDFDNVLRLPVDSIFVKKYLRGESLDINDDDGIELPPKDGWTLVAISTETGDFPLGFGKLLKGTLKNKYLPGWRMMS